MLKQDKNKAIATMKSYDNKLKKAQEELQRLQDKRDNFYMLTVANTLKGYNVSLTQFFSYLDLIVEDLEKKSAKRDAGKNEVESIERTGFEQEKG